MAADLLDLGCRVAVVERSAGDFEVRAARPGNPVVPAQLTTLATTNSVDVEIDHARFF